MAATALLGVAALGFVNFGFFHAVPRTAVHYWDAFHYFMGAKYLPELGYTRLYEAAWVAGRELGAFDGIAGIRDLPTYLVRDVRSIDAAAVRARFDDARWQAFKTDLLFFGPRIPDWTRLFLDHGYNDPPPRALLLHALVRGLPATTATLTVLVALDYVLLAAAFGLAARAFGTLAATLAAAFFLLGFFARFDFIGGSILRMDWIAALIAGAAALARGAGVTAGALLGYAVLARIFPALFLVPLVVKWGQQRLAGAPDRALGRCLAGAVTLVLVALLAMAALGGRAHVDEFAAKIRLHGATAFTNHVGLGTLLVFHRVPWSTYADGRRYVDPAALPAARPAPWVVPVASALYLAAAVPLILRAPPVTALMYAVPLVYCAVSPAGYYYSFLVLLVLLGWREGTADRLRLVQMALLALTAAAGYALEIASDDFLPLFYRASVLIALYFAAWLGLEYARLWTPARASGTSA